MGSYTIINKTIFESFDKTMDLSIFPTFARGLENFPTSSTNKMNYYTISRGIRYVQGNTPSSGRLSSLNHKSPIMCAQRIARRFCEILDNFVKCLMILWNSWRFCEMLDDFVKFLTILWNAWGFCEILEDFVKCSPTSHHRNYAF